MITHLPFPPDFLERLEQVIDRKDLPNVIAGYKVKKSTTIRVNHLKTTRDAIIKFLNANSIKYEIPPWYDDAFILQDITAKSLNEFSEYKHGEFYIQSLSSMMPALILDPQKDEKILDIAAAPGSKTTQIASIMKNTGKIIACDSSQIRLYKLLANLNIQGVTNTTTLKSPGHIIWQSYPEYFDRALVDVPCSIEGRFTSLDPKSYEKWSIHKCKELSEIQKWLLRSAVSATRPDGVIVYSTCTLAPEENEEVIDWIIKKEKGAVICESINFSDFDFSNPILKWGNKQYHESISNCKRILPSQSMEGFFIAKLKKIRSTVPSYAFASKE